MCRRWMRETVIFEDRENMKLSEVPEGVFVDAKYGSGKTIYNVCHRDGKVYYRQHRDDPSALPLEEWTVNDCESTEIVATLRARVAELESKLAKATRPTPAVGQVWRNNEGVEYVLQNVNGSMCQHFAAYADNDSRLVSAPLSQFVADDNTFVGIWTGEFPVKKVAK